VEASVNADVKSMAKDAQRVARSLTTGKVLRITAPNGTDFQVRLRGRQPFIDDGIVGPEDLKAHRNFTWAPPGFVAVAIDERSAEGMAIANRPSFPTPGRLEGGQWEMRGGHLGSYWYTEGQTTFDAEFEKAGRGKDIISYFSVGLNPAQAPGLARVEDQEAGAVTLGVGGNVVYGGSNRSEFLSYIVMGEATVAVDGRPLVDRGKLL
jgi:leucyl aminopeptidase (aminopeptidase T)